MILPPPTPIAWTIAGSDPGGGAGIQADLKTMNAFGVHGCTVVTALTAQNTRGVACSEPVSEKLLRKQLEALAADLPPAAIKTGMLGSARACAIIADFLDSHFAALDLLVRRLFPKVDVLAPNLPEAETILGTKVADAAEAAARLLETGAASVLLKGGHAAGAECTDYWTDGKQALWLSSARLATKDTHGTGCILSAAIASALALGQEMPAAVATAKTYLNQCLKNPAGVCGGPGPMMATPFRNR